MILYQRTDNSITLVIDKDSAVEIAYWDRTVAPIEQDGKLLLEDCNLLHCNPLHSNIEHSVASYRGWSGGDLLEGSGEGPYKLSFTVYANDRTVVLRVDLPILKIIQNPVSKKDHSYTHHVRSVFSFTGREASDLSSRLPTWCPEDLRSAQEIVLTIRGNAYRSLREWEHWVDKAAFTGEYTYSFSDNGEWDRKTVLNKFTGKYWEHSNFWSEQE